MAKNLEPEIDYLLLSDGVVASPEGKLTICGIYDKILSRQFPAIHPQLIFSMRILEMYGKHQLSARFVDCEGNDAAPEMPHVELDTGDRGIVQTQLTIKSVIFQKPGIYSLQILVDEKIIGQRDFIVEEVR